MKKCQIWCCCHRGINPYVAKHAMEAIKQDTENFDFEFIWGDAYIDRSRDKAAAAFLKSDYEVLLFIDDDIFFLPEHVHEIVRYCLNGYEIVAGVYPTKPVIALASRMVPGTKAKTPLKDAPPIEAVYTSTGFMAIHRKVFEALSTKVDKVYTKGGGSEIERYTFFETMNHRDESLSEDWAFCQRAKDIGFKCYLAPSIFLGHFGTYLYTLRDSFTVKAPNSVIIEMVGGTYGQGNNGKD